MLNPQNLCIFFNIPVSLKVLYVAESNNADGKAVPSSTAVGSESDSLNNMEMVEVKQEKLDELITVKPEPLHCMEDLFSETALVNNSCYCL